MQSKEKGVGFLQLHHQHFEAGEPILLFTLVRNNYCQCLGIFLSFFLYTGDRNCNFASMYVENIGNNICMNV